MAVRIKRAYESSERTDGYRVLIDRIWPRGVSKEEARLDEWARELELTVQCRQTNDEGEFVKWCHDALDWAGGIVANPGAWTHYSYAIHDALEILDIPIVEVHLSNILERKEEWRHTSVLEPLVAHRVLGKGPDGYREALQFLAAKRGAAA